MPGLRHSDGCHPAGVVFNFTINLHNILYTMIIMLSIILCNEFAKLVNLRYIAAIMYNIKRIAMLQFNVDTLLRKLALQNGRDYDKSYVAMRTGLSRTTVSAITNNTSGRVDLSTLSRLLDFFDAEGMPVTVGDLFTVATD